MERSVFDLFIKYLNNECTEEDAGLLKSWLEESDENTELFLNFKKLWAVKKQEFYESPEQIKNAQQKLEQRIKANERKTRQLFVQKVLRYAAILILLITIPWVYTLRKEIKKNPEERIVQVCNIDSVSVVRLADGTKVWLNKKSSLKLENLE